MSSTFRSSWAHVWPGLKFAATTVLTAVLLGAQCAPLTGDSPGNGSTDNTTSTAPTITIFTNMGKIVVELFDTQAAESAKNFTTYADEGYYDNSIVDTVAPNGTGIALGTYDIDLKELADKPLANESNNGLANIRGRVALYGPVSASEGIPGFLINTAANTGLDYVLSNGQKVTYTVIGKVTSGMDIVDKIAAFQTQNGTSANGNSLTFPVTDAGFKVRILKMSSTGTEPAANEPPEAKVREDSQSVDPGATVTLHGEASDPDGDPIVQTWELTAESTQALQDASLTEPTLSDATVLAPTFTAPVPSQPIDLVFRFTVTDDRGDSREATTTVTVNNSNRPVARAGADQTGQPDTTITFDGSDSSDPDTEDTLTYSWSVTQETRTFLTDRGLPVPPDVENSTSTRYSFTAPTVYSTSADDPTQKVPAILTFQMTVTDNSSNHFSQTDTVQARILPLDFKAPSSSSAGAGSSLVGMVVGDFNAGDKADVAVADATNSRVLVFINDGNGGFTTPDIHIIGASPTSIVGADFDQDGSEDLAVAASDNKLYVLLNDGSGNFTVQPTAYDLGPNPASLIAVDLDNKNGPDIVTVNLDDNKLSIRLNDGDGAFGFGLTNLEVKVVPVGGSTVATTGARVVGAAKLDGDSNMDLVTVFETTQNAAILLGQSGGTSYKSTNSYSSGGTDPKMIVLSDLDGDSKADSVIVLRDGNKVSVRRGNTDGTFGATEGTYTTGAAPVAATVADVNSDTYPDLLVANQTDNTVSLLQNKGSGAFKDKVDLALLAGVDLGPVAVATGDLDGDGVPDLFVANQTSGSFTVRQNRSNPSFTPDVVGADGLVTKTTSTWLEYKDVVVGDGPLVQPTSTVVARYTGRLDNENGTIFDTTDGTADAENGREFSLDQVVKGWKEGLGGYGMRVGGTRQLIIPSELGYGADGSGDNIPPHATLWFQVEVLEIK